MTLVVAGEGRHPLTDYERWALQELYEWKHPPTTWRTRAADAVEDGVERLAAKLAPELVDRLLERGLPS